MAAQDAGVNALTGQREKSMEAVHRAGLWVVAAVGEVVGVGLALAVVEVALVETGFDAVGQLVRILRCLGDLLDGDTAGGGAEHALAEGDLGGLGLKQVTRDLLALFDDGLAGTLAWYRSAR